MSILWNIVTRCVSGLFWDTFPQIKVAILRLINSSAHRIQALPNQDKTHPWGRYVCA